MSTGAAVQTWQQALSSGIKLHRAAQTVAMLAQNSACWLPSYFIDVVAQAAFGVATYSVLIEAVRCLYAN